MELWLMYSAIHLFWTTLHVFIGLWKRTQGTFNKSGKLPGIYLFEYCVSCIIGLLCRCVKASETLSKERSITRYTPWDVPIMTAKTGNRSRKPTDHPTSIVKKQRGNRMWDQIIKSQCPFPLPNGSITVSTNINSSTCSETRAYRWHLIWVLAVNFANLKLPGKWASEYAN